MRKLLVLTMLSLLIGSVSACGGKSNIVAEEIVVERSEESEALGSEEFVASVDSLEWMEESLEASDSEPDEGKDEVAFKSEEESVSETEGEGIESTEQGSETGKIEKEPDKPLESMAPEASEKPTAPPKEEVTTKPAAPTATPKPAETLKPTEAPKPTQTPAPTPKPASGGTVNAVSCNHEYHEVVVEEVSCAGCRKVADVCSLCGDKKNQHNDLSVALPSHTRSANSVTGTYSVADCYRAGQDYYLCDVCGHMVCFDTPALGHELEYDITPGNCRKPRWTEYKCTREGCKYAGHEEDFETDKDVHDWQTVTGQEYDSEKHGLVTFTIVQCDRCGSEQAGTKTYQ